MQSKSASHNNSSSDKLDNNDYFRESSTLFKDPKMTRRKIFDSYEKPVSGRESWWRCYIRETPLPGKYNIPTFINELVKKPNTYRFKSDGRRHEPLPQVGKGEALLPGAYSYEDFSQRVKKLNLSYSFKNHTPIDKSKFAVSTGSEVGPFSYDTTKYLNIESSFEPVKHSFFKSKEKRKIFIPKDGPSPGEYEPANNESKKEVTSCFKSKNNRFIKPETKVPGPGTYEPISAWINSKNSQNFSNKGVFFTPSAKVLT
ncbi:unnamed protein product [Brachionus calyciflorus]|uniref:Uncharacterized protein n=1 Tax=Brachionus calyciflorus TaxID=104777 RepID=A0A813NMS7_9BILA|nr:unnamed protein product [Brachionus calyciflorus]